MTRTIDSIESGQFGRQNEGSGTFWFTPPAVCLMTISATERRTRATSAPLNESSKLAILRIAASAFLLAFFLVRVAAPVADLDNWHEMALIRESLAAGHLLKTDVFAYTPTLPEVVDHEWGAGALLYFTVKAFGGWAIIPLKFLVLLGAAGSVVLCTRLRKTSFQEFTLLVPLVIPAFSLGCATLRAQIYSFLFFAILLYLLELDSAGSRRWIGPWIAMVVLWTNLHGGVVMGVATLGFYWIERAVRGKPHFHILGVIAASAAAISFNPFGLAYYGHLWTTLRMARPEITEWYGIQVLSKEQQVLFWFTLAILPVLVWMRGWRASQGALIVAAMAGGTILHARTIPFYAVAWAAYVPSLVAGTPLERIVRLPFRNRIAATAVCVCLTMLFVEMGLLVGAYRLIVPNDRFPVGAVRYLKEIHFHGNVMTHFGHGGYVSWWLYPAVKVSMDGRYDVAFPPALVDESFHFYEARPDWRETLAKYPTDLVLVPVNTAVAALMPGTGWNLVYKDGSFQLYARPGMQLPFRDASDGVFPVSFP